MPFLGHGGIWCSVRDQKRNQEKTKLLQMLFLRLNVSQCVNVSMCQSATPKGICRKENDECCCHALSSIQNGSTTL